MGEATLYLYRMPEATFSESLDTAGYWMSREPVDAIARITIDDLVVDTRPPQSNCEPRPTSGRSGTTSWPQRLSSPAMRLRNAVPRPERAR